MVVLPVIGMTFLGCAAASQYKFACTRGVCDVETSGPATLDFEQEFGETLEVVETKDGRVTLKSGTARQAFKMGESGTIGPLKVAVKNIKGELAVFTVQE
ncbi:hypothetical protein C8N24_4622 [Solirubrobacter pauli]|uniref:Uncharacterized protein n=2 Tax=Solirubrobacter pauli TaxID=166793 RepID=A0A660L117_9ACTN|nr:hypothetical protein C8N24_4622 [Solirubrobacter pauli]